MRYRTGVAAALVVICAFAASSFAAPPEAIRRIHTDMLAPSVRLNDRCSGTVVFSRRDPGAGTVTTYVLTAAHCLKGKNGNVHEVDIPVYSVGNRLVEEQVRFAVLAARSGRADLALLRLKDGHTLFGHVAAIAPASRQLYVGEEVWAAGYPAGASITLTRGLLGPMERRNFSGGEREYYRATPAVTAGSSGGGLYRRNDAGRFELIGLASGVFDAGAFMGLYTPLVEIAEFLGDYLPADGNPAAER